MNQVKVENVLDFPNEILILIFEYLLPSDRRIASECCTTFLEIWHRDRFIADRRLVFDSRYCQMSSDDSLLALIETQRKYDSQMVLRGLEGTFLSNNRDLWLKFGKTITTLELISCAWPDEHFWRAFCHVKVLKLEYLPHNPLFVHLPNTLELITVIGHRDLPLEKLSFEYLRDKHGPINIELQFSDITSDILKFVNEHHQKIQRLQCWTSFGHEQLKAPNLKHLDMRYYGTEVENLVLKFPSLQCLKLKLYELLPLPNWVFLKKLSTRIQPSNFNVATFKMCGNLEEFNIEIHSIDFLTKCFFEHKPYAYKSLKTFSMEALRTLSCLNCFDAMTKSFVNLENLTLHTYVNNDFFKIISTNLKNLRTLSLYCNYAGPLLSFEGFSRLSELTLRGPFDIDMERWPKMMHLRKLEIQMDWKIVKIFEKMPSLEYLDIFCCDHKAEDFPSLVGDAVKNLKRLVFFEIICDRTENDEILRQILKMHCKYIKLISVNGS